MAILIIQTTNQISLAILCGGQSRRFGTDKGLFKGLSKHTLVSTMLKRFSSNFCETLVVVKNLKQKQLYYDELSSDFSGQLLRDVKLICDQETGLYLPDATLSGVYAALHFSITEKVLIIPIDQLAITMELVNLLISQNEESYSNFFDEHSNNYLPFPSIWLKSTINIVHQNITRQDLAVKKLLNAFHCRKIAIKGFESLLYINTNSPAELQSFQANFSL